MGKAYKSHAAATRAAALYGNRAVFAVYKGGVGVRWFISRQRAGRYLNTRWRVKPAYRWTIGLVGLRA